MKYKALLGILASFVFISPVFAEPAPGILPLRAQNGPGVGMVSSVASSSEHGGPPPGIRAWDWGDGTSGAGSMASGSPHGGPPPMNMASGTPGGVVHIGERPYMGMGSSTEGTSTRPTVDHPIPMPPPPASTTPNGSSTPPRGGISGFFHTLMSFLGGAHPTSTASTSDEDNWQPIPPPANENASTTGSATPNPLPPGSGNPVQNFLSHLFGWLHR